MTKEKATEPIMLRVTPSTKEKWLSEVEKKGYSSMSGAIRAAMDSEFVRESGQGIDTEALRRELEDSNDDIHQRLDEIEESLQTIKLAIQDDPDLSKLVADIHDQLPRLDVSKMESLESEGGPAEWGMEAATVVGLMDEFDRGRTRIVEALQKLRMEVPAVRRYETEEGEEYYYVEQ